MHEKDTSTWDIGQSVLRVNDGLHFTFHSAKDEDWCLIEDEARSKVFRVGIPEYTVLSLLNGRRTLDDALAKTMVKLGPQALDDQGMARIAQWIVESGVAQSDASHAHSRLMKVKRSEYRQQMVNWLNPMSTRMRLFNPDNFVSRVEQLTRPFLGWWFIFVWFGLVFYGGLLLLVNARELFFERLPSYSQFDWAWFAASWFVLKLIHEASHALACKRFGGRVGQFGILFLLLIPLPFIDVTSSWRFENKYHRMLTSFAGMFSELLLASLALIVWSHTELGVLRHHIGNLIMAATVHTVFFNANPLMRFDGYYILADWLEIPNLSTRGRNCVKNSLKRLFFGANESSFQDRDGWIVRIYGWASIVWTVLICFSLSAAAIALFGGAGLIMALIASVFWLVIPFFKLVKFVVVGTETETPNRIRFATVVLALSTSIAVIMTLVPAPAKIVFPVIVDYADLTVVRAEASGFVDEVLVDPGQSVELGQALVRLKNPDLVAEFEALKLEFEVESIRARTLKSEGKIAQLQQQEQLIQALDERKGELSQLVDNLVVRSPVDGVVSSTDLRSLQGTFAQLGAELLRVGSTQDLNLIGLVDQDQAKWLRSSRQYRASTRIWGELSGNFVCELKEVPPRASQTVNRPAFAANYGGPLAVTQSSQGEEEFESDQLSRSSESVEGLKFLQPQVEVVLTPLNSLDSKRHPGQMGLAKIRARGETLGRYVYDRLTRLATRHIQRGTGI